MLMPVIISRLYFSEIIAVYSHSPAAHINTMLGTRKLLCYYWYVCALHSYMFRHECGVQ